MLGVADQTDIFTVARANCRRSSHPSKRASTCVLAGTSTARLVAESGGQEGRTQDKDAPSIPSPTSAWHDSVRATCQCATVRWLQDVVCVQVPVEPKQQIVQASLSQVRLLPATEKRPSGYQSQFRSYTSSTKDARPVVNRACAPCRSASQMKNLRTRTPCAREEQA